MTGRFCPRGLQLPEGKNSLLKKPASGYLLSHDSKRDSEHQAPTEAGYTTNLRELLKGVNVKKKSRKWHLIRGLQLPKMRGDTNDFDKWILMKGYVVKDIWTVKYSLPVAYRDQGLLYPPFLSCRAEQWLQMSVRKPDTPSPGSNQDRPGGCRHWINSASGGGAGVKSLDLMLIDRRWLLFFSYRSCLFFSEQRLSGHWVSGLDFFISIY